MSKLICADCRDGEHDNITDDVKIVTVKDPDTGKLIKRSYMCSDHVEGYLMDGYLVYVNGAAL